MIGATLYVHSITWYIMLNFNLGDFFFSKYKHMTISGRGKTP